MKQFFYLLLVAIGISHIKVSAVNFDSIDNEYSILNHTQSKKEQFFVDPEKMPLINYAWSINTVGNGVSPSAPPSYYSAIINGQYLPGARPWEMRWDLIKDATVYKGKRILELGCCTALASTFLKRYRGAAYSLCIDAPDYILKSQGSPDRLLAAKLVAHAFDVEVDFAQIDLNRDNYEEEIGYDFDIALCMSLLRWIDDKDRLMHYLSHFSEVIFEGHDPDQVEIERFKKYSFDH